MIEAGVLVDLKGDPIYWHMPRNRTNVALPDSRDLWEVIWEHREHVLGFAHSHPGNGVPGPSYTDVTTFSAVELALGKRLDWWITSSDSIIVARWEGPASYSYKGFSMDEEPAWVPELRRISAEPARPNVEGRATS